MKTILTVIKKDLKRIFTDPRMLIGLFLPGIVIFVMYSFMGDFITESMLSPTSEYVVYTINSDENTDALLSPEGLNVTLNKAEGLDENEIKEKIRKGEVHALVKFSVDFYKNVAEPKEGVTPEIEIFYSSVEMSSSTLFSIYSTTFDALEDSLSNVFNLNSGLNVSYDCSTTEDTTTMLATMLMPMLLLLFLWTGCMTIAADSIAGEKERGTIATLLITPVKRSNFAIAKVLGLSLTALASGLCSTLGTFLSLPNLLGGEIDLSSSVYSAQTYVTLFAVIIITVLLFNIILLMISTFAKSVKEATTYASTAMIVILLIAVSGSFGSSTSSPIAYLVPIYNSSQCFSAIFALNFNPLNFAICILSNAIYIALGVWALTKMFNNEKIMFNK